MIVDGWHVPTVDPYTFTAQGTGWVVQSWLPSVLYALVEDLAGGAGLRLLMGLLCAGIAGLVWRLAAPAQGLLVRVGIVVLALAIGNSQWSSRPLLVGLLALLAVVLAAEGRLVAGWLVPIGWLWVNSHGSFPLGVVYLGCVLLGTRLDGGPFEVEWRALRMLVVGFVLGAVNPLGPRLLWFPVELVQRQDVLRVVREWQAPGFESVGERLFLLQAGLCVLALVRRPSYRKGLVVAVFLAAALLGSRNIAVASLVFVPVLAASWGDVGSLRVDARLRLARPAVAVMAALVVLVGVAGTRGPHFRYRAYPVTVLEEIEDRGIDLDEVRLGGPELVGNLLELRGARGTVFFDDRFDLFSDELNEDLRTLHRGAPGWDDVLERWDLDLVVWRSEASLSQILAADPRWRVLAGEEGWRLFCRRAALLTATTTC